MKTHIQAHTHAAALAGVGVLARAVSLPPGQGEAGEFCYMPAGANVIEAKVDLSLIHI